MPNEEFSMMMFVLVDQMLWESDNTIGMDKAI